MLALHDYLSPSSAYKMYKDELIPIFCKHDLLCYHATRIDSKETIFQNGLVVNKEQYLSFISKFLKNEKVPNIKIDEAVHLIDVEFERKLKDNPHRVCFFTNLDSLHDKEGLARYDVFCGNVGGEMARWALEHKMLDVFHILHTKGVPVAIAFRAPFSKIVDIYQYETIHQFVVAVAAKFFWNYDYIIKTEGSLNCIVEPSSIISIDEVDEREMQLL